MQVDHIREEYGPVVTSRRKRIYIAGPMANRTHFNFPAFHKAAQRLRDAGWYVFNPAEADIDRLGVDPSLDNPTGDVALAALNRIGHIKLRLAPRRSRAPRHVPDEWRDELGDEASDAIDEDLRRLMGDE